ncbi:MAG TPA: sialate O-acetylesterase [Candidatus Limnocylindrales bacterium]|nr:sialate O-acetylesterase [Candidatus Limnocylindrales bacterium]
MMPRTSSTRRLLLLAALLLAAPAHADVSMTTDVEWGAPTPLFSNGMILQREMTVPIFGKADAGESVTVTFNGQQKSTVTGADGRWRIDLDPMVAGGPLTMTVTGNNTIVISDVRIGEVWIAGGQSNMRRLPVERSVLDAHPTVRTLIRTGWNDQPGINPYKFALDLEESLGVPIGILNLAVSGSSVASWLGTTGATDPDPAVQPYLIDDWGINYRRLVKPLQPFRFRGVIWWQGEEDARHPQRHRTLYPAVIRSWRAEWGNGDFPWISMQVPTGRGLRADRSVSALPSNASASDKDSFIRQTYVRALAEFPYTSFASSLDLKGGTHPPDTDAYSTRLFYQALALVYGESFLYSGPLFSSMEIEGSTIRIHYRNDTDDGLTAQGGGPIQGFAITGDNVTWHWADVAVDGNDIVLSSASVASPVAARYAWGNRPTWANLVNAAGLAAAAFSTEVTPGEYGP